MRGNITSILGIAVLGALAVCFFLANQRRIALGWEHHLLENRVAEMAALTSTNQQLPNSLGRAQSSQSWPDDQLRELLRLRGEIGVLRRQASELETAREENRQAREELETTLKTGVRPKAVATADYWPQDSWSFKGYATADAALQSSLWAANNGDVKAFLASATEEMQKMIREDLKDKSETEASIRAMDEVMGIKSIRVLNREPQGDDTLILTAELEGRSATQTQKLVMKKIGNEWKLSGPAR